MGVRFAKRTINALFDPSEYWRVLSVKRKRLVLGEEAEDAAPESEAKRQKR